MASNDDKIIPVKVALRIRPISTKESREGCQTALELIPNEPQVLIANSNKCFTYDYAFDGESEQVQIYSQAVRPILEKIYKGFNVTVLAYGQTGSGKTFTMGTSYTSAIDQENEGVIPRVVRDIFNHIDTHKSTEFLVKASFIELYNEQLFDLLSPKPKKEDTIVDIREDVKGIKIPGLTEQPVGSLQETMNVIEKASGGRVTAATAMNLTSSRSHAIFTLSVEARPTSGQGFPTMSKFHMVDLAGSERQNKTKAKGVRLKEGININMGLLALGNVISALGDESKGGQGSLHIPYRDSKLTRLLQDSLGGNSHTLMIACCSPADSNIDETISTLRYADRARKIKNKPIENKEAGEIGRLRAQCQQLQLQLLQCQGVSNPAASSTEVQMMREQMDRLSAENLELTSALQSAMEDSAHMSEKLLLSEQAQDTLRVKLTELSAQTEEALKALGDLPMDKKDIVEKLRSKVESVMDQQKQAEKTMMEHDMSRFNPSRNTSVAEQGDEEEGAEGGNDGEEGGDENTDNLGGATQALRQNQLATQLAELNKNLLSKQELAAKMGANDEKLAELKNQYENQLKTMEDEISKLQIEKDQLQLQQRNAGNGAAALTGGSNKLSEQRRKRIQELEGQILNLKKQQQENIRLVKMNQQSQEKAKKLSEEIRNMKQIKVKLIKQMKEESERVRVWKQTKEKELNQLKQKDRKAQFQMAKMERLHERQKNVLKRKMEETMAANKRLKDAMEKKNNARKIKGENDKNLAGSGDRVRNWISSELDVVVSEKEAHAAKENLIKDRKELNQELQKLKQSRRKTLTDQERKDIDARVAELQQDVDMRNAQINELQQQILSFNEEKEKDKACDRWTQLNSMVEARIAAQYLFDTATELTTSSFLKASEIKDLKSSLEEITTIRMDLQDKLEQLKVDHEDQIIRMERDHEEKVLFLLRQLSGTDTGSEVSLDNEIGTLEERLRIQQKEIDRMSSIHDQLMEKDREVSELREQLKKSQRAVPMFPSVTVPTPPSKRNSGGTKKKRVAIQEEEERYKEEEFFTSSDEEEDTDTEDDSDQEWRMTPLFKRIRKERMSLAGGPRGNSLAMPLDVKRKRRSSNFKDIHEIPEVQVLQEIQEDDDGSGPTRRKRSSNTGGCTCKSGCKNNRCSCKKQGPYCSILCKCPPNKCANREVPGDDVSDASCMSNMETSDVENNENTAELLDSTFDVKPGVEEKPSLDFKHKILCPETPSTPLAAARSPLKAKNSADIFAMESDVEATPTNPKTQKSFFKSPILQ